MSHVHLWERCQGLPLGGRAISLLFGPRAPYFATVRPQFTVIEPHRADSGITCIAETDPDRWAGTAVALLSA